MFINELLCLIDTNTHLLSESRFKHQFCSVFYYLETILLCILSNQFQENKMDSTQRKKVLDELIEQFEDFTKQSGWSQKSDGLDSNPQKKVYRNNLETKEDVSKILIEEYLKEYKESEQEVVDIVFKGKSDVKKLRIKKKRLDTKRKEFEKEVKSLKREQNKLQTKIDRLEEKITDRKSTSEELNKHIVKKRKQYQNEEVELKKDIQGVHQKDKYGSWKRDKDGNYLFEDDEYYLKWFRIFIELQQLYDGKKITLTSMDTHPKYRVRFFGGEGTIKSPRNGFEIHGRVPIEKWRELSDKLDRQPTKEDVLPIILPKIQEDLKSFFGGDRFKKYLRRKTKPIGSGYGKYKRVK